MARIDDDLERVTGHALNGSEDSISGALKVENEFRSVEKGIGRNE
jgi:hypothetical protein